jgi:hypothetical protein
MSTKSRRTYQPNFEVLEDRYLPSTHLLAALHGAPHPLGRATHRADRLAAPAHHHPVRHHVQHHVRPHPALLRAPGGVGSPPGGASSGDFSGVDPSSNDGDFPAPDSGLMIVTPVSGSDDPFGGVSPGNG